jgi:hypothetical protein
MCWEEMKWQRRTRRARRCSPPIYRSREAPRPRHGDGHGRDVAVPGSFWLAWISLGVDKLGRESSWAWFWESWRRPGKLIDEEVVAYWHRSAVDAGEEEGRSFSPRTIFKDSETVFGSGWACPGLAPGLLLGCWGLLRWKGKPGKASLSFLFSFQFSVFIILFCIWCLNSNLISVLFCRF